MKSRRSAKPSTHKAATRPLLRLWSEFYVRLSCLRFTLRSNSSSGGYTQCDPIGLAAGSLTTLGYVRGKVSSTETASTVIFVYDLQGSCPASTTATARREYVWQENTSVAMFTSDPANPLGRRWCTTSTPITWTRRASWWTATTRCASGG